MTLLIPEYTQQYLDSSLRVSVTKQNAKFPSGSSDAGGVTHQCQNSIYNNFILNYNFKKIKLEGISFNAHPSSFNTQLLEVDVFDT